MAKGIHDYWDEFMAAVAEPDQPRAAFAVIEKITKETIGTKLFTAMTYDADAPRQSSEQCPRKCEALP